MGTSDPTAMQYAAGKALMLRGVQYQPGDPVDVSFLPEHKIQQFLNQRLLRPVPPSEASAAGSAA